MAINPFFNFTTFQTEQSLLDSLIVESIQIYGHDALYLPRETVNLDTLFGEDPLATYGNTFPIELYLKSNISFAGPSETFSKFGLTIEDDATFVVAATRFTTVLGGAGLIRPRENDLIVIDMQANRSPNKIYVFEIRFVEDKEQLFQLGQLYTYELRCQLMNYSHEQILTGNTTTDNLVQSQAYTVSLHFASGNGAFAYEEVVYQGDSFPDATATAIVTSWQSPVLEVQDLTGEFTPGANVTGITSGAVWTLSANTVDTLPSDVLADNAYLANNEVGIVVPIVNPRFS